MNGTSGLVLETQELYLRICYYNLLWIVWELDFGAKGQEL